MDLRRYFNKLQEIEQRLDEPWVVVVSEATPDGGRAGVTSEVARAVAAKLVVEGRARIATEEEGIEHRLAGERAREAAERKMLADRVQVTVLTEQEVRAGRGAIRPSKG